MYTQRVSSILNKIILKMLISRRSSAFLVGWVLFFWVISARSAALPPCQFAAIYNFGDSNSDTGGISAAFEPIRAPYGEAFFHKPAGRDSDGRLIIDFIAEQLGLPYLSAYLNSLGVNFRHGANFATGGSTIRRQNETIFEYGISPFSLDMQIVQFNQFKARTAEIYRDGYLSVYLSPMLQLLALDLHAFLLSLPNIYGQGGRAFWIHNTGPIGCLPVNRFYILNPAPGTVDDYGCIKAQNEMAMEFNKQLKDIVVKLRTELPEAAITHVDVYTAKYKLISNSKNLGFADPLKVCCGFHHDYDHVWCGNKGMVNKTEVYGASCEDPSVFISWDGVHYSQAANQWVANHNFYGSLTDPPIPITQACHKQ
ncbi:GDSL esterase/lipase At5g14450 [Carica papaya]|uniref:GDSL esterase/lipase At5g14450 n=1 Tax=Carica papaya TaxID=3649 RepID=UPI000B8D1088|nr:GDSL esterase/lipase At5g14450 [Carica papaya]